MKYVDITSLILVDVPCIFQLPDSFSRRKFLSASPCWIIRLSHPAPLGVDQQLLSDMQSDILSDILSYMMSEMLLVRS